MDLPLRLLIRDNLFSERGWIVMYSGKLRRLAKAMGLETAGGALE